MLVKVGNKVKFNKDLPISKKTVGVGGEMLEIVAKDQFLTVREVFSTYCTVVECGWSFDIKDIIEVSNETSKYEDVGENVIDPKEIEKIAKGVYGDDKVFLHEDSLYIHFPELTIRNQNKRKHVIYDMYIRLYLGEASAEDKQAGRLIDVLFDGIRTTFTLAEFESRYTHSHISVNNFLHFSPFCLGTTPFRSLLSEIEFNPTTENWELLFLSIIRFLEWESLEGGPYMRFGNVRVNTRTGRQPINSELKNIISSLPIESIQFDNFPTFVDNESLQEWLNKNSKIRDLSTLDTDTLRSMYEEKSRYLKIQYPTGIKIGNRRVEVKLIPLDEENAAKAKKPVSKDVRTLFLGELNQYTKNYGKIISYDRDKSKQQTFNEIGII